MASNAESARALSALGADPILADALDATAVEAAVVRTRPDAIVQQLTSLPKHYTPEEMRAAAERDGEVRLTGGANLLRAASAAGVRRLVASSGAYFHAAGEGLADETSPFALDATPAVAAGARLLAQIEEQLRGAPGVQTVALRCGFFYGPGTWYWTDGDMAAQVKARKYPVVGEGKAVWSFIHVEDAAQATVLAVESAAPAGVYVVTDDQPVELRVFLSAFAHWVGAAEPPREPVSPSTDPDRVTYANRLRGASNAKIKRELGFRPRTQPWLASSPSPR
jgi:nucleoside-diphosphate-sugar epimerase